MSRKMSRFQSGSNDLISKSWWFAAILILGTNVVTMPLTFNFHQDLRGTDLRCRESGCPQGCVCKSLKSGGSSVDCSFKNLSVIPDLPINTEQLSLAHNLITKLPGSAFRGCTMLTHLSLSSNKIRKMDKDAFQGLNQLKMLSLEGNLDRNSSETERTVFAIGIFRNLDRLQALDTHEIYASHNNSGYFNVQNLVGNLTNLRFLGLNIQGVNPFLHFHELVKLEELHVYGFCNFGNNTLKPLARAGIKKLVCRCVPKLFAALTFSHLTVLEVLDLSGSRFNYPKDLSVAWPGLKYTNVSVLHLDGILKDVFFLSINGDFFKQLQNVPLKELSLGYNGIEFISFGYEVPSYLSQLKYLSLQNNTLELPSVFDSVEHLYNLTLLNLNDQNHKPMSSTVEFNNQRNLCASGNVEPAHVDDLDNLDNSTVPCASSDNLKGTRYLYVHIPPSLEYLLISNGVKYVERGVPIPSVNHVIVYTTKKLRYINYSRNGLTSIVKPVVVNYDTPEEKLVIDMSGNNCAQIEKEFGAEAGEITKSLLLSGNRLGAQLAVERNGETFGDFTELTNLDLSNNVISNLQEDAFGAQAKMEVLNLSSNFLTFFNVSMKHMINLTLVDISNNRLYHVGENQRQEFEYLAAHQNLTLSIANNPFLCSCDTLDFLDWIMHTSVNVVDLPFVDCNYNGDVTSMTKLQSDIIPELNVRCSSKVWLTASLVALSVVLLMIVVSVVLYRHRFEVRYLLLKLAINRKRHDAGEEEMGEYRYDAFVAFDKEDIDWINDALMPNLEGGEPHFRLCVHHRDFTGGAPIVENIAEGICSSRKVLLVLSENFLASSWCQFELETSQIRSFEEGKDLIVPVILGDLPAANMSRTLRVLLKRNTYIMWPQQQEEVDNFWGSLRRALESRPSRIIRCQCGKNINL